MSWLCDKGFSLKYYLFFFWSVILCLVYWLLSSSTYWNCCLSVFCEFWGFFFFYLGILMLLKRLTDYVWYYPTSSILQVFMVDWIEYTSSNSLSSKLVNLETLFSTQHWLLTLPANSTLIFGVKYQIFIFYFTDSCTNFDVECSRGKW